MALSGIRTMLFSDAPAPDVTGWAMPPRGTAVSRSPDTFAR